MVQVTAEMIERGRSGDPKAAAQRRQMTSKVREARERLTSSGTGLRAFDIELLRIFARARTSSAVALALLAAVLAAMASVWVQTVMLGVWLALVLTGIGAAFWLARAFLAKTDADLQVRVWKRRFVVGEAVQGLLWALLAGLFFQLQAGPPRTFVLVAMLLVAAMNAVFVASIPAAVYAAMAPIAVALIVFMRPQSGYEAVMLTALAVGAQIFFILLAGRLYATSLAGVSYQAEKDALIAELEQAKANSDEARRRAEEASLAKSRFLATMSHELRTPLNAILGFSEVMKGELFGAHATPAYREYSSDIHASGQHLLALINEILDLSRVEAGRQELREESVSISNVVEDCRHLLAMRANKRDITIAEAMEPDLPRIWSDERAIRQVMLNLLTNAIKFTPQGGQIFIKVGWTAAGGQYVSIRDTGPGIPENEIPVVLSSFGRGAMALKNADEGSGLGLPIVKGLIELHGGTFILKSKVREGTEAIVILPPERVMAVLPQLDPDKPVPASVQRVTRPAA